VADSKSKNNSSLTLLPNIDKIRKRVIAHKSQLLHQGKILSSNSTSLLNKNKNLNQTESLLNLRHRRSGSYSIKNDKKNTLDVSLINRNNKTVIENSPPLEKNSKKSKFVLTDYESEQFISREVLG